MSSPPTILTADVLPMLGVVAAAAGADRGSHWCQRAADQLCRLLGAQAAMALDIVPAGSSHRVSGFFDVGLTWRAQRSLMIRAVGRPHIGDPFLRGALRRFAALQESKSAVAFTCGDLLTPLTSRRSVFCPRRAGAGFSDCLISVASLAGGGKLSRHRSALVFFKTVSTFSPREKNLVALCHPTLAEVCAGRLRKSPQHAAALSPRLRQTLGLLASGGNERAIARKMNLSYHTVHDYVKHLFAHFAVTSRKELLSRWSGRAAKS